MALFVTIIALSACSGKIQAPAADSLAQVDVTQKDPHQAGTAEINIGGPPSEADMAAEAAVSEGCVSAWRKALKGDEQAAMAELDELDRKYPKMLTVRFMRGQCLEQLGKKKEAIKYYKESVTGFEFGSIRLWKLAEAMRTTGDARGALPYYRKLMKANPDFNHGKIGLARALIAIEGEGKSAEASQLLASVVDDAKVLLKGDKNSKQARAELQGVVEADPRNKEAASLLSGIKQASASSDPPKRNLVP